MKKMKCTLVLVTILVVILTFMLIGHADMNNGFYIIEAALNEYTFNYKEIEGGNTNDISEDLMQTLNYNNELYVPLKQMLDMLDMYIEYDEINKLVEIYKIKEVIEPNIINEREEQPEASEREEQPEANESEELNKISDTRGEPLINLPEYNINNDESFIAATDAAALHTPEKTFDYGLVLREPLANSFYSKTYILGKQYNEISFTSIVRGPLKEGNVNIKFVDLDKNVVLNTIDASMDRSGQNYTINVSDVDKLQIIVETGDKLIIKYIMGNIYLN